MNSRIARMFQYCLGVSAIVCSIGANLLAVQQIGAPEIDGGSMATGLGLLAAGILILRARRGAK